MQTDGKQVEAAIRRGARTVCVMTPVEFRILMRRWGAARAMVEAIALEARREAGLLFQALTAKRRR